MADEQPQVAQEAAAADADPASVGQRAVSAKWFFVAFGVAALVMVIFSWRFFGGSSAGERLTSGGQFAPLPEAEQTDLGEVSDAAREAAALREATQDIEITDLMPDREVVVEPEVVEEEEAEPFIEPPAVIEPPPAVVEEAAPDNQPEAFAPELLDGEPQRIDNEGGVPYVAAPQVEEPAAAYVGVPVQGGNDPDVAQAVYGVVITEAASVADEAEEAAASGGGGPAPFVDPVPGAVPGADEALPLKTYQWLGRLVFPWHSEAPVRSVVRVTTGPYRGQNFEMQINKVDYQVAGAGRIGPCHLIGMTHDFRTPLFAPNAFGDKVRRTGQITVRHAFAGMSAAADAYSAWLLARASQQPQPIIQISDAAAAAAAASGQPLVIKTTQDLPKPDLGALAAGGSVQSIASDIEANREIKVLLPANHPIGLAAICNGEPRYEG